MKKFTYTIQDEMGLHARPAGLLCKKAQGYSDAITLIKSGRTADAKKLFSVMSLGVKKCDTIEFQIIGENEEMVAAELERFCRNSL